MIGCTRCERRFVRGTQRLAPKVLSRWVELGQEKLAGPSLHLRKGPTPEIHRPLSQRERDDEFIGTIHEQTVGMHHRRVVSKLLRPKRVAGRIQRQKLQVSWTHAL